MMVIQLRPARPDDLPLLLHWDRQQHNIDADPNDDWNWEYELPRQLPWRHQLIAEVDGRPIGFLQIIDPYQEETHYWGEVAQNLRAIDIWIRDPEDLGKGYGTEMMRQALNLTFLDPEVRAVLIDPLESNTRALKFYEKIGFKPLERRLFGQDQCLVYRLDRKDWAPALP